MNNSISQKCFLLLFLLTSITCSRSSTIHDNLENKTISYSNDIQDILFQIFPNIEFSFKFHEIDENEIIIESRATGKVDIYKSNNIVKDVALYTYINQLGVKIYGAADHWIYIPKLDKRDLNFRRKIKQNFSLRKFSPSYGIGKKTDELRTAKKQFNKWMKRLRSGNDLALKAGHQTKSFSKRNKKILMTNPNYMAYDNGRRMPWDYNVYCYSQEGLIDLLEKDFERRLLKLNQNEKPIISVEPSDNPNFCRCNQCQKNFKSNSDRVFYMANRIADKALEHNAYVTLYGYSTHACLPNFSLRKNVIVGLVPSGYQNCNTSKNLTNQWLEFHDNLYLRDYLYLPQWNFDMPKWGEGAKVLNQIRVLKNAGGIGYNYESTASSWAVGWLYYLISEESWRNVEISEEIALFDANMFEGSNLKLKELIEYFKLLEESNNNYDYLNTVLKSAKRKANSDNESKRIEDLIKYSDYIYNFNRYNQDRNKENSQYLINSIIENAPSLGLHSWGIYNGLKKKNKSLEFDLTNTRRRKIDLSDKKIRYTKETLDRSGIIAVFPQFYSNQLDTFPSVQLRHSTKAVVYFDPALSANLTFEYDLIAKENQGYSNLIIYNEKDVEIGSFNLNKGIDKTFETDILKKKGIYNLHFSTGGKAMIKVRGPGRPFAYSTTTDPYFHKESISFWTFIENNPLEISFTAKTRKVKIGSNKGLIKEFNIGKFEKHLIDTNQSLIYINSKRPTHKFLNNNNFKSPTIKQTLRYGY